MLVSLLVEREILQNGTVEIRSRKEDMGSVHKCSFFDIGIF
jgi:hypothetical protein